MDRAKVIGFMCEHFEEYEDLDTETINADFPRRIRFGSMTDCIASMADPTAMPGELEIMATSKVLQKPILILNTANVVIQIRRALL